MITDELNIYLSKIELNGVKESWVEKNLPNLYNFLKDSLGNSFSEKVFLFLNKKDDLEKCKCGEYVKFLSIKRGYREYCSKKCSNNDFDLIESKKESYKKTNIEKYGVDNPMLLDEVKNKMVKSKSKLDYDLINKKFKKTLKEKYGVDNPSKLNSVKMKKSETTLKNYGVDNPFKSEEIKEKIKKANTTLYGVDHPSKSKKIKNKSIKTLIRKYGVDNPMKSDFFKDKFKNTCLDRYGVDHFYKSDKFKEKQRKRVVVNHNKFLKENNKKIEMVNIINGGFEMKCLECKSVFNIYTTTFHIRKRTDQSICTTCNPIKDNSSFGEKSIYNFVKDNYIGEILSNIRMKKEIDVYLPELNLGFEYNGLYWHSEKFLDKKYHTDKMLLFEKKDINIINIWEDDWLDNTEIVKSMILNKIGVSKNKIWARKCDVKVLNDNKLVREFLNNNHIQGFVGSKVKLGLFHNGELVSIMTFGDLRKSLGQKSKDGHFELLRFCNVLNTNVVGGASKLFKYFIRNYDFSEIITYSKNDYSDGNLYKILGFNFHSDTVPNYYWVVGGKRINRFNFRKDKLVKNGEDSNLTEVEILTNKGYFRVFDSGNKKWVYK